MKTKIKARIEALETEIGRILQMSPEVRAEMGFDWHLKCLATELNALEAAEEAASQFSQIGNGIYVHTKATTRKTYLPKVCRVRFA